MATKLKKLTPELCKKLVKKGFVLDGYVIDGLITARRVVFKNCRFCIKEPGSLLTKCEMVNCTFGNNDYFDFDECNFSNCNFNKCSLYMVDFHDCSFITCNFGTITRIHYTNWFNCVDRGCTIKRIISVSDCYEVSGLDKLFDTVIPMACPRTGAYTAYKKCYVGNRFHPEPVIVTLEIPETAKRSSAFGNKCRASEAMVVSIVDYQGKKRRVARSMRNNEFEYRVGKTVSVADFNPCRFAECSTGIHHFMDIKSAKEYIY